MNPDAQVQQISPGKASEESENNSAIMTQVEKLIKLESNKKVAVSTVARLIRLTKEKHSCYLCK